MEEELTWEDVIPEPKIENKLLQIINHYGVNNQQRKLEEEVFELQEVISLKLHIDDMDYKEHIEEEIADVMVMLKQIQYYFNIKNEVIDRIMEFKINRQLERIKNAQVIEEKIQDYKNKYGG